MHLYKPNGKCTLDLLQTSKVIFPKASFFKSLFRINKSKVEKIDLKLNKQIALKYSKPSHALEEVISKYPKFSYNIQISFYALGSSQSDKEL